MMNEQEQAGFNLAVDLYTNLLFNQKELITRIIEVSYTQGLNDGIAYGRQEYIDAVNRAREEDEEVEEEVPEPKTQPPKLTEQEINNIRAENRTTQPSPAEELIAKMKGVKR